MDDRAGSEEAARSLIREMYEAALAAAEPEAAVCRHLHRDGEALVLNGGRWPVTGRVVVVGAGKAAVAMARGVERSCGELIDGGLVITKDGHRLPSLPRIIDVVEAAHPIPDHRGVDATRRIIEMLQGLDDGDLVIALVSGGGSALLEAPVEGVSLEDMARLTDLLLRAGAPIHDLNAVRAPLSRVKGGGLLQAAGRAPILSLILSDVLGNDPRVIASGPTVQAERDGERALEVLESYGVLSEVPRNVIDTLKDVERDGNRSQETENGIHVIVADNDTAIDAAAEVAHKRGKRVSVLGREKQGEASLLGAEWVRACREADAGANVLVGGGEATVAVRGDGVGGRNTEFALAAAIELGSHTGP
ncbi:MAG TPA: glycerate kinase, partial [Thermomicrobiales bacterium]|nr:glycerate kinase [Thermomicrobiales bacterium]